MKITCNEFESLRNEQIDAGTGASVEVERALEQHAATCPVCGPVASRLRALAAAPRAWGPPPVASKGFTDRLLAAYEADRVRTVRFPVRAASRWAAAAAVLVAGLIGLRTAVGPDPVGPNDKPAVVSIEAEPSTNPRALSLALADAT